METITNQKLEDFMTTKGFLPMPLHVLESNLKITDSFTIGAQKCAQFFRRQAERFSATELLQKLFQANPPSKWLEYFSLCLCDVGYSDIQCANQILRLKCLRRMLMRRQTQGTLSEGEHELVKDLKKQADVVSLSDLMACAYFIRQMAVRLLKKRYVHETHQNLVVFFIRAETKALRERIDRLSAAIDPYDLKEMSRILPYISLLDENIKESTDLANAIDQKKIMGKPSLTFEQTLHDQPLESWTKDFLEPYELALLGKILLKQKEKKVPHRALVALASLCRWILTANQVANSPLIWLDSALKIYHQGRFSVNAGKAIPQIKNLVENGGAWLDGNIISGSFSNKLYTQWIGHDRLTRPLVATPVSDEEVNIKDLILMHINNESLILRLLDNSKIYTTYGLVEYIATHSRSVNILAKIASFNNLYSGVANQGVPLALFKNSAKISLTLLRQFLKPSFFQKSELRDLLGEGSFLRPEVFHEIKMYLES